MSKLIKFSVFKKIAVSFLYLARLVMQIYKYYANKTKIF